RRARDHRTRALRDDQLVRQVREERAAAHAAAEGREISLESGVESLESESTLSSDSRLSTPDCSFRRVGPTTLTKLRIRPETTQQFDTRHRLAHVFRRLRQDNAHHVVAIGRAY